MSMLSTTRTTKKASKRINGNGVKASLERRLFHIFPEEIKNPTALDGIRHKVFTDRYSLKGKDGNAIENFPEQMWRRVARAISYIEKPEKRKYWEDKFFEVMKDFKFVPGGRILSGAGTGYDVTYYNCFVIPSPQDSRHGILKALAQLVDIQAHSGGVGLNLSSLRPRGARVKKVNGTSSGPVNWAELFSVATHDVVQQGGTRRGATMLMLWDWHPDIEEFITVKKDLSKINGANLSICISDAFMEAVKADEEWQLIYPNLDDPEYDDVWEGNIEDWKARGKQIKVYKTVKARELWNLICEAAWQSAEPGLHFLERSNTRSNTWYFEKLIATNPCGEQPLSGWAVCNLGAMNLSAYVKNGEFDYDTFGRDVRVAMRFLDNVIDETHYFFSENEKCAKDIRRTGLGIMGLADALIKMNLAYGSEDSLPIIRKIFETLRDNAYETSADISLEKGAFPKFDHTKYLQGYHIQRLPEKIREKIKNTGIRNAVLLTIAPTGTTSLLAGVSSGVEPVFEFEFTRKDRIGEHKIYHPLYEAWKNENPDAPKPRYFVSANDLTPAEHVKVQAVAQEYIDSSISKTVNAPNTHTVDQVKELYMLAYDMGLKGITYMRDGSRPGVLTREEKKEEKKEEKVANGAVNGHLEADGATFERPEMAIGATYKVDTPLGKAFITINQDEKGNPLEVFINVGKAGSDITAMAEALGRLVSAVLRTRGNASAYEKVTEIIHQLHGIGGRRSVGFGARRIRSLPDAVAVALTRHFGIKLRNGEYAEEASSVSPESQAGAVMAAHNLDPTPAPADFKESASNDHAAKAKQDSLFAKNAADICPSCGAVSLVHEESCSKCYSCGHAEC